MSRPAVSRQLRLLADEGLVVGHDMGFDRRALLYTIDDRQMGPIVAWLAGTEVGRSRAEPAEAAGIVPPRAENADVAAPRFWNRSPGAE